MSVYLVESLWRVVQLIVHEHYRGFAATEVNMQICMFRCHSMFCTSSEFPTTHMEMEAVADIFDQDRDGYINYKEFIAALRPDRGSSEVGHLNSSTFNYSQLDVRSLAVASRPR